MVESEIAPAPPATAPVDMRADAGVHYAYLGLAAILYSALAGYCYYYIPPVAKALENHGKDLPIISVPLFRIVLMLGPLIFGPLAIAAVLEAVAPRRLTRLWLLSTLVLLAVGLYVGIALWLPAQRVTSS